MDSIASWGGAGPWVIFGSGANIGTDGYVWDVSIDTVYNVYVIGNFTTVTGAATVCCWLFFLLFTGSYCSSQDWYHF